MLNFGLSILLARHYGAIGVAWGTFAGALLGVVLHLLQSMRRTQDLLRFDRAAAGMRQHSAARYRAAAFSGAAGGPIASTREPLPCSRVCGTLHSLTAMIAWRFASTQASARTR